MPQWDSQYPQISRQSKPATMGIHSRLMNLTQQATRALQQQDRNGSSQQDAMVVIPNQKIEKRSCRAQVLAQTHERRYTQLNCINE